MLTLLSDEKYAQAIAQTPQGVLIGFKKLCPHCKNMEKVLEKCADRLPGAVFMGLDTEENPDACGRLGIERVPTLLIIKQGAITAKMAGLLNPKEFCAFYQQSMRTA